MSIDDRPGVAALRDRFATFRYSAFRLETLQVYRGSGEDDAFAAFQAGRPIPVTPELQQWCQMVRRRVAAGHSVARVHVVTEPLTDYMRFELASYAPNVEAGEDVRILSVARNESWPADVPHRDFWLFDSSELWDMSYAEDGMWLGAEPVGEPRRIVTACRARDAALAQSGPWSGYARDHPDLSSYLAATAKQR